ncbi:hypothetical protein [Oceanivirga miroungae]|uniref:PsbP C-terminal domain-containing protein n=1 Tax=Oceanivirga miroungae TaxID=1130046 RepID=A0A6I8M9R4_9FUSO|nr:hypothetical protein [Oceanivirga miroungae]VWL85000.1 hypothetical protein OMES3154_00272 [Oceanivirga miroungae]
MKEIKKLKQKCFAIIISLALISTWYVPSIISSFITDKKVVVKKGEKGSIKSFDLEIKFDAPTNWERSRQESDAIIKYESKDEKAKIVVEVLSDSTDFKVTLDRYIKNKNRANKAIALTDEKVEKNGFKGKYFYVVEPIKQLFGKGAVLYKNGTFLSVISYGNEKEATDNLMKILDSLEWEAI